MFEIMIAVYFFFKYCYLLSISSISHGSGQSIVIHKTIIQNYKKNNLYFLKYNLNLFKNTF